MDSKTIRLLLIVVFCGISWANANLYWQEFQSLPEEYLESEHSVEITLDEIPQVYQYHTRITGRVCVRMNLFRLGTKAFGYS